MPRGTPTTEVVTALFTDIVRSTEIAGEVGDARWRELVAAHHALVREHLKRHHGREQDTAGDGFFAAFKRPAEAIRCAIEISDGVRELGLEIRAGLHLGEAEVMGPKVGGVAVNTAARIMALGKEGEVLVSGTVRDAVAGKGIDFVDHGLHQLKGFEGEYHVWDAVAVDGTARGLPLDKEEARRRREEGPPAAAVRRRSWWLVAAGIGVLAAAGIALATTLVAEEEEPGPTGVTSEVGRPSTDADAQVIDLVPTALSESCRATDPLPRDAVGSVTCADDVGYEVRYDTYADAGALDGAFVSSTAGLDLTGLSCRDDRSATDTYTIDGEPKGRIACFVTNPTALAWVPTIVWTDDELLVLGRAQREFLLSDEVNLPDLSVYEWWRTSTGPGPGGSFRPKDEPAEVLTGTFRSVITSAQAGPASEGGADTRWVGTWTISFEDPGFVETFADGKYVTPQGDREDQSYELTSGLLWGKGRRLVLMRDYEFPPLGGVTPRCERLESLHWELQGDMLVFSEPSQERPCQSFRDLAVFQPWERVG